MTATASPGAFVRTFIGAVVFACATGALGQSGDISVTVIDEAGQPVIDAVVVAMPADGKIVLPARPHEEIVDQVDKEFSPKVKAVVVGTPIRFPNKDNVRHQVYSFSGAKRFELPLYAGVPAQPVVFDKPGVVVLGCNIHDWMVGYIYVSDSPYFGKTGKDGNVTLAAVPAQTFVVRVWHALMEGGDDAMRKTVDVSVTRKAAVTFTLNLKPEVKLRRAPVASHGSHY